jgi:hypothetical protein
VQSRTITNCTVAFFTFLLMLFVQYSKYIGFMVSSETKHTQGILILIIKVLSRSAYVYIVYIVSHYLHVLATCI